MLRLCPPVPVGQKVLQRAPALGHHFVHQLQHAFRVSRETIRPSEGFKAMAHEQGQRRRHQFPWVQIDRHGLKQIARIQGVADAFFSVRSEVLCFGAVASQQLGFRHRWVNGTVVLSERQYVGGVLRIEHRAQQCHHRQRHRVTAQMQTLRSPRGDTTVHEVLSERSTILVAAQEHHDFGQRK